MANPINDKLNQAADALKDAAKPRKTGNVLADSLGGPVVRKIASTSAAAADAAAKLTGGRKKGEKQ